MDVEELQLNPELGVVLLLYSLGMDVKVHSLYSRMVVDQNFLAPWLEDEVLLGLVGRQLVAPGLEVELLYRDGLPYSPVGRTVLQ